MSLSDVKRLRRLFAEHLSTVIWSLLGISVLMLILIGARLPQEIQVLSSVEEDKTGWNFGQIESGFYQLSAKALHESRQFAPDSDAVRQQAEILLGRLSVLRTSNTRELLSGHREVDTWYETIKRFETLCIQIIDQPGKLSVEDILQLDALTRSATDQIRQLSVAGFIAATEKEEQRRLEGSAHIIRFGLLAIVLLLGLAITLLYLARLLNRARRADADLRASASRLSATLDASLDGVVVADENGRIIDFNKAATRVFGWSHEDIVGKLVNDTISPLPGNHENWRSDCACLRFPKVHNLDGRRFESTALRKSGYEFPVEVTVTSLVDAAGDIYLIAFKDISDRKISEQKIIDAREEAERTNRAKTQFLRAMSHEMRTPLTVISGVLELLGLEKLGEREARYVASAASSSEMLIALINDALDITRVETGDITLNPVRFSLREILEQAVSMIEPLVHHKGLTISIDFDINLDRIYIADKVRLSQIVTNLLSNALKYTSAGSIKLVASGVPTVGGELTRIQIIDTGRGIPEDEHERIFDYFVTTSELNSEQQLRSDGLGLPLSRKIARLLGGDISIQSKAGEGSIFTLEIFLDAVDDNEKVVHNIVPVNSGHLVECQDPLSVLIVDDASQSYLVLENFLNRLNHQVVAAGDGKEGVEKASLSHFDLIIMDINLPELDGFAATRRIRNENGPNQKTVILGLTAYGLDAVRHNVRESGMDAIYAKPMGFFKLQEILKNPAKLRREQVA